MKTLRKREQKRRRRNGAKTRRRCRTRRRTLRGGSTTEQIGAAAQMRAFMPFIQEGQHPVRYELNNIVHHERSNQFSDPQYNYNQTAQNFIDEAYEIIKKTEPPTVINDQMRIARDKAQHSGVHFTMPISFANIDQEFPSLPHREQPPIPTPTPNLVHVPVDVIYAPHRPPSPPPSPSPHRNTNVLETQELHRMLNFARPHHHSP